MNRAERRAQIEYRRQRAVARRSPPVYLDITPEQLRVSMPTAKDGDRITISGHRRIGGVTIKDCAPGDETVFIVRVRNVNH